MILAAWNAHWNRDAVKTPSPEWITPVPEDAREQPDPRRSSGQHAKQVNERVGLFVGDICNAPADVICTSTNTQLELIAGTGGSVRERGSWDVQEACKQITEQIFWQTGRRAVEPGTVHYTRPGKLPHAGIIHCAVVETGKSTSEQIIEVCTLGALNLASKVNAHSIALPFLGTGKAKFDFHRAVDVMIGTINSHPHVGPKRIWLVAHNSTRAKSCYPALAREFGWIEIKIEPGRTSCDALPKL